MREVSSGPHEHVISLGHLGTRQEKNQTGLEPTEGGTIMKSLIPLSTLGLAGAVSLGVLGLTGPVTSAADGDAYVKREEQANSLVLVSDDDDDDSNDDTGASATGASNTTAGTGSSRSRADGTNSRFSAVSRDRDLSRGDMTKDGTRDGGDHTRDLTPNLTNDSSKNDTR